MRETWLTLKESVTAFVADHAQRLAAAVAFYAALSLAPLLILVMAVAGLVWQEQTARDQAVAWFEKTVGPDGAAVARSVLQSAGESDWTTLAGAFSLLMLIVAASAAFGTLRQALNLVWKIEPAPKQGLRNMVRARIASLIMVGGIVFLLLASLAAGAVLSYITGNPAFDLPAGALWAVNHIAGLVVFTLVFAAVFTILPDAKVRARQVILGAFVTAILFEVGRLLLGIYIGRAGVGSAYGAAGSLAVLLVWVYYSVIILLFGAELIQTYATRRGRRIEPTRHARRVRPLPAT